MIERHSGVYLSNCQSRTLAAWVTSSEGVEWFLLQGGGMETLWSQLTLDEYLHQKTSAHLYVCVLIWSSHCFIWIDFRTQLFRQRNQKQSAAKTINDNKRAKQMPPHTTWWWQWRWRWRCLRWWMLRIPPGSLKIYFQFELIAR